MNKKVLMIAVALIAVAMLAVPMIGTAEACGNRRPRTIVTRGYLPAVNKNYTQINVVLGGANNTIRIPDDWNGMLVVLCRGSSTSEVSPNEIPLDSQSKLYVAMGFATAANHFSFSSRFSQKEAIIRTHQLTKYVINNYGVTGKVILSGVSFGGGVALLLGEKYPELYSGVLDIVGTKDAKTGYEWLKHCASLSISELTAEFTASNLSPFPYATLEDFQQYCLTTSARMLERFRGTPEEKPKAYERESPTYHANIRIPVITIAGARDAIVPLSQHLMYKAAVADAGHEDLYRLVIVPTGAHFNVPVQQQIGIQFQKLVTWVLTGVPPP